MYSNASGSFGCGAFTRELGWFQIKWPKSWEETDIATKELVPVVVATAIWVKQWPVNMTVFIWTTQLLWQP